MNRRILATAIAGVAGTGLGTTVMAQDAVNELVVEEVVVTARKRSEDLMEVPVSIKAMTGDFLEELNAETFTDYAAQTPSLNFGSRGAGLNRMSLRGMQAIRNAPTVSYIIDDIAQQVSSSSPDTGLFDIERIEVLRGPQGTLFGEGAVGGAIRIITNKADPNQWSGKVGVGYTSIEDGDTGSILRGMVNVPVIEDTLGVRAMAYKRDVGGWIDQYDSAGNLLIEDGNDEEFTGGRLSTRLLLGDSFYLNAIYNYHKMETGFSHIVTPTLEAELGEGVQRYGGGASYDFNNIENEQFTLQSGWDIGFATVEAIFGQSTLDFEDSTPLDLSIFGIPGLAAVQDRVDEWEFTSGELRLVSDTSEASRLSWVVGVFWREITRDVSVTGFSNDLIGPLTPATDLATTNDQRAVFGDVSYQLTDKLSASLGLRWFQEDVEAFTESSFGPVVVFSGDSDADFDDLAPKFGLSYQANDDLLVFGNIAKGYRSGGVNIPRVFPIPEGFPLDYDSDEAWSYELGTKWSGWNGRVSVNAAIFYNQWSDMQSEWVIPDVPLNDSPTINAGEAHTQGIEFDITALLAPGLTAMFGGALIEAETDEDFTSGSVIIPKGTSLENVPEETFNASLDYELPLFGAVRGFGRIDWSYRSDAISSITTPDASATDAYSLWNLQAGLRADSWTVTAFVENAADESASSFNFEPSDISWRVRPRTVGLRADYRFD